MSPCLARARLGCVPPARGARPRPHRQGRLIGRLEGLGFELQAQATAFALTADALGTAAIEGERLDPAEVRSSVAQHLGLPAGDAGKVAQRAADGLVSVFLDATLAAMSPSTLKGPPMPARRHR